MYAQDIKRVSSLLMILQDMLIPTKYLFPCYVAMWFVVTRKKEKLPRILTDQKQQLYV